MCINHGCVITSSIRPQEVHVLQLVYKYDCESRIDGGTYNVCTSAYRAIDNFCLNVVRQRLAMARDGTALQYHLCACTAIGTCRLLARRNPQITVSAPCASAMREY